MPRLRLRRARPADRAALAALERNFPTDRFSDRALRYLLRARNAWTVVAEDRGSVAGALVLLFRRNSRGARIYSIAVARGIRNRGVGAALVRAAEREARRRGCAFMSLEVKTRNRPARALYARFGYNEVARMPAHYADGANALRLRKPL